MPIKFNEVNQSINHLKQKALDVVFKIWDYIYRNIQNSLILISEEKGKAINEFVVKAITL